MMKERNPPLRKPIFEKVPLASKESFLIKEEFFESFNVPWHTHPEYELTAIVEGRGTIIVGDHISTFKEGDLILIGPNLPHLWRSDTYREEGEELKAHQLVIQFSEDFAGPLFLKKLEMAHLMSLLKRSAGGLVFAGETSAGVIPFMRRMILMKGFDRFISLLTILDILSSSENFKYYSTVQFIRRAGVDDEARMNKVYNYVFSNFKRDIKLAMAASQASLVPAAFSRYFKQRTKKKFSEFVLEVRIGHACKLLLETNKSVSQISCESGFNNLSNFNRSFKLKTKHTPGEYIKLHANRV